MLVVHRVTGRLLHETQIFAHFLHLTCFKDNLYGLLARQSERWMDKTTLKIQSKLCLMHVKIIVAVFCIILFKTSKVTVNKMGFISTPGMSTVPKITSKTKQKKFWIFDDVVRDVVPDR